jgi:hypothetical protein
MKSKKSSFTFNGSGLDFLHNKYVLYISFFFAILTAARYLLANNLEAVGIFVIVGFLTTYFSKNMIIVLLTTTILTNFIVMVQNRKSSMIEGMETKADKPVDDKAATPEKKGLINNKPSGGGIGRSTGTESGTVSAANTADASKVVPSSEVKPVLTKKKNTETMSQLTPASVGAEADDPMIALNPTGMAKGYDAQKEQAYNALSGLAGGVGGANNSQMQAEMINNLKTIEPILKTAENFLDKFENSSISKIFANMGNIPGMSLLTGGMGSKSNPAPVGAES